MNKGCPDASIPPAMKIAAGLLWFADPELQVESLAKAKKPQ